MNPFSTSSTRPATATPSTGALSRRLRKLGSLAFLFFLVKGLLWLLVPAALLAWRVLFH